MVLVLILSPQWLVQMFFFAIRYTLSPAIRQEAPDILSHCAVRARNFGVLLCTCASFQSVERMWRNGSTIWLWLDIGSNQL